MNQETAGTTTLLRDAAQQSRRRKTTQDERLTPCQFCNYPLSQRHHALPVAIYGENDYTLQLCANCHEFYHLVLDAFLHKKESLLLQRFRAVFGEEDIRWAKAYHFIAAAVNIAAEVKP